MSKINFYSSASDCGWIARTALKNHVLPKFSSFMIQGNEDCPEAIALYASVSPFLSDKPVATYELQEDLSYTKK